jgi:hypothetical protein
MLAAGKIPEPMRNSNNGYRIWSEVDLTAVREALKR